MVGAGVQRPRSEDPESESRGSRQKYAILEGGSEMTPRRGA